MVVLAYCRRSNLTVRKLGKMGSLLDSHGMDENTIAHLLCKWAVINVTTKVFLNLGLLFPTFALPMNLLPPVLEWAKTNIYIFGHCLCFPVAFKNFKQEECVT